MHLRFRRDRRRYAQPNRGRLFRPINSEEKEASKASWPHQLYRNRALNFVSNGGPDLILVNAAPLLNGATLSLEPATERYLHPRFHAIAALASRVIRRYRHYQRGHYRANFETY